MRIGIVCPYEWTVPGGVGAHVRGLATELRGLGHQVDVLAPAERPVADEHFVGLGGSLAVPYNGSVARLSFGPTAYTRIRRWINDNHFDVLHIHEPNAPSLACALGVMGMMILTGSLLVAGKILGKKMGQLFRA